MHHARIRMPDSPGFKLHRLLVQPHRPAHTQVLACFFSKRQQHIRTLQHLRLDHDIIIHQQCMCHPGLRSAFFHFQQTPGKTSCSAHVSVWIQMQMPVRSFRRIQRSAIIRDKHFQMPIEDTVFLIDNLIQQDAQILFYKCFPVECTDPRAKRYIPHLSPRRPAAVGSAVKGAVPVQRFQLKGQHASGAIPVKGKIKRLPHACFHNRLTHDFRHYPLMELLPGIQRHFHLPGQHKPDIQLVQHGIFLPFIHRKSIKIRIKSSRHPCFQTQKTFAVMVYRLTPNTARLLAAAGISGYIARKPVLSVPRTRIQRT